MLKIGKEFYYNGAEWKVVKIVGDYAYCEFIGGESLDDEIKVRIDIFVE